MKERQYIARRQAEWQAWDRWLAPAKRPVAAMPEQLAIDPAGLPQRFRRLCHDLALVRDRNYSATLAEELQQRVLAVHQYIYGAAKPEGNALLSFFAGDLPVLVRGEWRVVVAAMLLLLGPLLAMLMAIQVWPDAAFLLLSPDTVSEIEEMYSPAAPHFGRPRTASSEWAMWAFYIAHNVRIDFQSFAGGIAFGLGTVFYLLYNGLYIGAIAGHLTQIGLVETFWGFVAGHSAFELTGAVLAGAAGLKLGMALLAPGLRTRLVALQENGRVAVRLLYGAAALTFLAAFIEAFWSPLRGLPLAVKIAVGCAFWLLTGAYLLLAGRRSRAT
ncbi:stage II sporulation protein M [Accumulibacter sp.]|uniref:stage II sporulation protein M n=1 Tax=Accumulibacter sp. TaxID=2053492 RepID=UPI00258B38F9|nr:stage II sporulation protein M [Accumulibacter sp.]MCM8579789.1 stage II sporulation protein M [Accumulibacter sp.]